MIQRIQSLWLFIAALFALLVFFFPIAKAGDNHLKIGTDVIAIILNAISIGLSMVAIFLFKDRKKQKQLSRLNILINIALFAYFILMSTKNFFEDQLAQFNQEGYYWIGMFIPLVVIIFTFMALKGISKDDKLIRSLDRLR